MGEGYLFGYRVQIASDNSAALLMVPLIKYLAPPCAYKLQWTDTLKLTLPLFIHACLHILMLSKHA